MADGPRNRPPFTPGNDRSGRGKESNGNGNRRDDTRRTGYGGERGNTRDGGVQDRGGGASRFGRRDGRPANPQTIQRHTVHYQVVSMDDEEWGDTLENRLNALGRDGWRLIAIDEGRQYVFMQAD